MDDRKHSLCFFAFCSFFLTCCAQLAPAAYSSQKPTDNFSALFQKKVSVAIDPLEVVFDRPNQTDHGAYCSLSIHRENCLNPKIRSTEKIVWSTRICFKWICRNTTTHAMRVENCWTGSSHMPLYLIDKNGCSLRRT
ncbi:hypothetical protein M3Y99_00757800 [Aphelenchoides fujianensis]|nr:hypothetical protein M3Y99_00757800 [Aphelenchoides fujianensis]